MTDEKKRTCSTIDHPNLQRGWGCCSCATFNGDQRDTCKHCQHARCGALPKTKVVPYEKPDGTVGLQEVNVPTDPKKTN